MLENWVKGAEGFSYTALIVAAAELIEIGRLVEGIVLLVAGVFLAFWHHRK